MRSKIKIGARLAQCRETLNGGQTQEVAAAALGIKREYLAALETNRGQPSYDLLLRMADYYKTTTDWILGHSEQKETLPEGAQKILEYLSGMSVRGRAQLLKVAQVLYEEDKRWKRHDAVLRFFASVAGKTALANLGGDKLPAMLAEFGSREALAEYVDQTFTEDVRGNEGQEV